MAAISKRTLISMTGFGRAQTTKGDDIFGVVLNSVNNRNLKVNLRMPDMLYPYEKDIQDIMNKFLVRGSVNAYLTYKTLKPEATYAINAETVKGYIKQAKKLQKETKLPGELTIDTIMGLPGVVMNVQRNEDADKKVWPIAKKTLEIALKAMNEMRGKEGAALQKDLFSRIKKIEQTLKQVIKEVPVIVEDYRKKLHKRITALMKKSSVALDKDGIAREVAIFADRCDISEEITRLKTHLTHFMDASRTEDHPGRKLDFITQEMLREVNTMGAKANSAKVAGLVVHMKAEIGKIKEQVQNVE